MTWIIKKCLYRIYHIIMKAATAVLPFPEPELLTGDNSSLNLPAYLSEKKISKIVFVTDRELMRLDLPARLLKALTLHNISVTLYDSVSPNPTIEQVEKLRVAFIESQSEAFIAFGGGSPIDCAKGAAARCYTKRTLKQMKGYLKVFHKVPPVYAIPTTAGTGSECTVATVITDSEIHQKFVVGDLKLVPKAAVLDSNLTKDLPQHITASTGMDALTHAIEAFIGIHKTAYTDRHSKNAVRIIFSNLEKAYNNGHDIEARKEMACAAFFAGLAFTRASVGYVHAIAHNLGSYYGVPHGLANAIVLPFVLDYFANTSARNLAQLAVCGGITKRNECSEKEQAKLFIKYIRGMNNRMRIPSKVSELKINDIPVLAKRILKEGNPTYPVPKIMTLDECTTILWNLLP